MSMLGEQIKELWRMADELDEHSAFIGYGGSVSRDPYIRDAAVLMREAADTIESLRDRLQGERTTTRDGKFKTKYGRKVPLCECCGYAIGDERYNYCPKCGARIKEVDR